MSLLDIAAVLFGLSAFFGYLNNRFLRLPHTIGLVVIALIAANIVVLASLWIPGLDDTVRLGLEQIDFSRVLLEGMLCVLLFTGAVHINLTDLADRKWSILSLATFGVVISTILNGTAIYWLARLLGADLAVEWALVFGALISPTDPVAVIGILKTVRTPRLLEAKIAGESLFNDGVGVVLFTVLLAFATTNGGGAPNVMQIAGLFGLEVFGGGALGLAAGWLAYRAMRGVDEHNLEVLVTLALASGVYAAALQLHLSAPIAVVVAGLLIGNHGAQHAMSARTREHVFQFWDLLDEILNSVLFLLIGLQVLVVIQGVHFGWLAAAMVPLVLLIRLVSVAVPLLVLGLRKTYSRGAIAILTWGGLRGGISVALALSLPAGEFKTLILTVTYAVVVFSIVVQGLTMRPLVNHFNPPLDSEEN
ncbi:MAG: cation:proton antiporter [Alphaproteobacteria bacterium]